jgi:hypothetical protein
MIACCQLCYEKYITEDGNIDYHRFYESCKKHIEYLQEHRYKPIDDQLLIPVCKCRCHKDGLKVLH